MKNILLYTLLIVGFISCKNTNDRSIEVNKIALPNKVKSDLKLHDYAKNPRVIPLEFQGDKSLISSIEKLEFSQSRIFVLNRFPDNRRNVVVFSDSGKFLKTISSVPADNSLSNAIIDLSSDDQNRVFILDSKYRIMSIDDDLLLKQHMNLPFAAEEMIAFSDNFYFHTKRKAMNFQEDSLFFQVMGYNGEKYTMKYFPFEIKPNQSRTLSSLDGNFSRYKEEILFNDFLSDTIYSLKPEIKNAKYVIDYGADKVDKNTIDIKKIPAFSPLLLKSYNWGLYNILETNNYLSFGYFQKNLPIHVLYKKKDNELMLFNPLEALNDKDIIPMPKYTDGNKFYGVFQEADLGLIKDYNKYERSSIMGRVVNHITNNANPVLVEYQL